MRTKLRTPAVAFFAAVLICVALFGVWRWQFANPWPPSTFAVVTDHFAGQFFGLHLLPRDRRSSDLWDEVEPADPITDR